MARLHARTFKRERPWSAEEFAALLDNPHVFATGDERALALGRVVAGEAELLTLATDPAHRRLGLGRGVLAAFEAGARDRGAAEGFLEVAADNTAALALYRGAGWQEAARRAGYYARAGGLAADAVVMRRAFT